MIQEIEEIKKWCKDKFGDRVPDGWYVIPIKGVKYHIEIRDQLIYFGDKVIENKETIYFSRIRDVKLPTRANEKDAGIDFYVPMDFEPQRLFHGDSVLIPSGIKARIPHGYMLCAFNKSGVASKKVLDVLACVVDEEYQGEIHINLVNAGYESKIINPGEKIIQFILIPVSYAKITEVPIEELYDNISSRGEGGFGSSGH